jgi:hypothetical protein
MDLEDTPRKFGCELGSSAGRGVALSFNLTRRRHFFNLTRRRHFCPHWISVGDAISALIGLADRPSTEPRESVSALPPQMGAVHAVSLLRQFEICCLT